MRRQRLNMASGVALVMVASGLTYYAVNADGQAVHRTELNDGGVWVTDQSRGALGRQNVPISQLDAYVDAGDSGLPDVLQEGSAVLQVDLGSNVITPVSPARGASLADEAASTAGPAQLNGGTLAVIDPRTGRLWATRVDTESGVVSVGEVARQEDPITQVGPESAVTVTASGTVIAVSGNETTTLSPAGTRFAEPVIGQLSGSEDAAPRGAIAQMTAVGQTPVVLDGEGFLIVAGHRFHVGTHLTLQRPGEADDEVFYVSDGGLVAVDLATGTTRELPSAQGEPAEPVRFAGCLYAAWAQGTTGRIVRSCDGQEVEGPNEFDIRAGADLVFRVNRGQILLNDVYNGDVWSLTSAIPEEVTDWQALDPETQEEQSDSNEETTSVEKVKQAPQAKPDDLGARPGRTTVLHVLDNDLVSGGGVLTITGFADPEEPGVQVQMAPDRQSLLATLSAGVARDISFAYTISDGTGGKDSVDTGRVSVRIRSDDASAKPTLREEFEPDTYPLAAGASMQVAVLDDWRDHTYGDPVTLDRVGHAAGVETSLTAEGLIRVQAAGAVGRVDIPYLVSTGGPQVEGSLAVNVLANDSLQAVAPKAKADVAAGEVNSSITIDPLDNDIAGADPTDPEARLALAAPVAPKAGLRVDTDLESGVVTVRAPRPGSYTLKYSAAFGIASTSNADIRVEVEPASAGSDAPIALPDTATVRGVAPTVVDVLANDYDAKGRLLAVQFAEPSLRDQDGFEVAVIDGRWLRISATGPDITPKTQAIEYIVSNGAADATGTVTITQKDPLPDNENVPITEADAVTVRVDDTVAVPVLDNDSTPGGDPLILQVGQNQDLPMGEVVVRPALGHAYVSGRNIRYVAPQTISGPRTVKVTYVALNTTNGMTAPGTLTVRLNPEPTDRNPNQPPAPRLIEARVVEGDTVRLRLPLVGNDPDGDSVSVVGIGTPPMHGRLLSYGANLLEYQAFPGSPGTDEFTYVVTDRYGETAEGTARVAVVPPGTPQAPVAVNDDVTASPGVDVEVDVLANDLRPAGTKVAILPLESADGEAELASESGPVTTEAPGDQRDPAKVLQYRITNGLDESVGELTVRAVDGFNNPPVISDIYASPEPDSGSVEVDALDGAYDIDGEGAPLHLDQDSISVRDATFGDGGTVTLPVLDVPQVVPYRVTDDLGAASVAVIYVPARPTGAPYLKPDTMIQLDPGQTLEVALSEIVEDPDGDTVYITLDDRVVPAPPDRLTAGAATKGGEDALTLTAGDLEGPAAVTFEVSDRAKLNERANVVTLSAPVQIGDPDPIINCPTETIPVVIGAASRVVDIATICHVWTLDPAASGEVEYTVDWAEGQKPYGVEVNEVDGGIQLGADINADPDAVGTLDVSAVGSAASDELFVKVVEAGPPTLAPVRLEAQAGAAVSVDLARYSASPLGALAEWAVVGQLQQVQGPRGARIEVSGTRVTITPPEYGVYTFRAQITDGGSGPNRNRPAATNLITVSVVSEPEAPSGVRTDGITHDRSVTLLWNAPFANGGQISKYTVRYSGPSTGTVTCASTRCDINGLTNAREYTFWVTAHNQFGQSEESAPVKATPDRIPSRVENLRVTAEANAKVTVAWSPPADAGQYSRITDYYISWPGSGQIRSVSGTRTSFTATGLSNGTEYTFDVWPVNAVGPAEERVSTTGVASGRPAVPTMNAPQVSDRAGNTQKAVTLSWAPVDPNGRTPVEYQVTRTGGPGQTTILCGGSADGWTAATDCADDLGNDGTTYSYRVKARNGAATSPLSQEAAHVSADSAAVTVEAAAPPDGPTTPVVTATGVDKQVKVTFDVGASHGSTNVIECQPSCGTLATTTVANDGAANISFTVTYSGWNNGGSATFQVRTCNGSSGSSQTGSSCSDWRSDTTTPYGPIPKPSLSVSVSGQCFNWSASGSGNGKQVTATLKMGGATIRTWNPVGTFNGSGTQCPGYSITREFTLSVADSGATSEQPTTRPTQNANPVTRTTEAEPKKVTVQRGSSCSYSQCQGAVVPCSGTCYYISVTTAGFPGSVHCDIYTRPGNSGAGSIQTSWTQGGNTTHQGGYWLGYPNQAKAVCGGVTSNPEWVAF